MTSVFLITKGCYSDYRIVAAFSTRELAESWIRSFPDDDYGGWNDIAEFPLDYGAAELEAGHTRFWIQMDEDGNALQAATDGDCTSYSLSDRGFCSHEHATRGGKRWFNWFGWARDLTHAIKIANEYRIYLKTRS